MIVPYWTSRSPEKFYDLLVDEQATVLNQTPSAFNQLVQVDQSLADARDLSLRLIIFGGESLELQNLTPWFDRHGDQCPRLVNMYGITETTVHVTYRSLSKADLQGSASSVIGGPIPDLQLYVLDRFQQLVPVGVPGEIYVGGAGLARCYLNRPDLSAERFIPNPFSATGGERLYKTGDLARYLADGDIEYLGRTDHQVKIRGFRIELGEITAALSAHPAADEAVVIADQDAAGDKRLIAFVIANHEMAASTKELRVYLESKLPDYMVPASIHFVESFPLNNNGKLDQRALRVLANEQIDTVVSLDFARTPIEEMLISIWAGTLNISQMSIDDNFFELGGHSLLATQVVSRIRENLNVDVSLKALFESPRISDLALVIESLLNQQSGLDVPPIVPVPRAQPLPLSFAQQRLWFLDQLEPNDISYNVPVAVKLTGTLDVRALEAALCEIIKRHEVLRTTFAVVEREPVQIIHESMAMNLSVEDFSDFNGQEREAEVLRIATEEAQKSFDLSHGPLLRARLLRLDKDQHIFFLTMHHIITDEWSMGVFIKEIATLYEALSSGKPSPLLDLAIQYADYAHWQRNWLQGGALEKQRAFWRQQLAGNLPTLKLPIDRQRVTGQTFRGRRSSFTLPKDVSRAIKELGRQEGATIFMTLMAVFKVLLYRYTQQQDILIGTAIANRNKGETEQLIGFFVNTLVIRTKFSGDLTFKKLLGHIRETTLGAYVHQDMPFDKLVEEFAPDRNQNQTPLFQVAFGMRNAPAGLFELPGLSITPLEMNLDTGRFDLTLWMTEGDDGLQGDWFYNTDLFDLETIKRMQRHFASLLRNIVVQPDAKLDALDILTEEEKQERLAKKREREESNLNRLKNIKRRVVGEMQSAEEA